MITYLSKVIDFSKDLFLSDEFKKGILIGSGIMFVSCVISYVLN